MKKLFTILGIALLAQACAERPEPVSPPSITVTVDQSPGVRRPIIHRVPEDRAITEARIRARYYIEAQQNWIAYQEMMLKQQQEAREAAAERERERQYDLQMRAYERQQLAILQSLYTPYYVVGGGCWAAHSHNRFCR